jgi:hypothetical protein
MAFLAVAAQPGLGQQPAGHTVYRSIEVATFSAGDTFSSVVALPEDWRILVETELVKRLVRLKGCELVSRESSHAELPEPALRLVGRFTKFKPGSHMKRLLSVPGIGSTIIEAHVQFLDRSTGAVLAEGDVRGRVDASLFPFLDIQSSLQAARELADDVVQIARKKFFHS